MLCVKKENLANLVSTDTEEPMRTVPLLPVECKMVPFAEGITTATFYEGNLKTVEGSLRSRIRQIVTANPWLAGTIVHDGKTKLASNKRVNQVELKYPTSTSNLEWHLDRVFCVRSDVEFPSEDSTNPQILGDLLCKIEPYCHVPKGIVNKDIPVCKFSAFRMESGFVLVYSLSHLVADGHTYYTILDMLHDKNKVYSMNVDRKECYEECMVGMWGEKVTKWHESKKVFSNWMLSALNPFAKKSFFNYSVDTAKVKSRKAAAVKTEKVKFVSTNDILTSDIAVTSKTSIFQLIMNMRGRIPEFDELDAGNYMGHMWLNPAQYQTPGAIREKLVDMRPSEAADWLPGTWKTLRSDFALITNWTSSFKGDLNFDSRAKQLLHVPVWNFLNLYPSFGFSIIIVYTPRPGETAVMYMLKNPKADMEDFVKGKDGVMGNPVEIPFARCAAPKSVPRNVPGMWDVAKDLDSVDL